MKLDRTIFADAMSVIGVRAIFVNTMILKEVSEYKCIVTADSKQKF